MDVIELVAGAAHALVAAAWFGAMVYSLAVVQPRSARFLGDDDRSEAYAATLASGARRPVLAVIALLLLSGATLLAIGASEDRSGGWWALMAVKGALLLAAAFVFWRVSWRLWPARVLALAEELPPLRRRFATPRWRSRRSWAPASFSAPRLGRWRERQVGDRPSLS